MQLYLIHAEKAGRIVSGPWTNRSARRKALELDSAGFSNIILTDLTDGLESNLERFLLDHPHGD